MYRIEFYDPMKKAWVRQTVERLPEAIKVVKCIRPDLLKWNAREAFDPTVPMWETVTYPLLKRANGVYVYA